MELLQGRGFPASKRTRELFQIVFQMPMYHPEVLFGLQNALLARLKAICFELSLRSFMDYILMMLYAIGDFLFFDNSGGICSNVYYSCLSHSCFHMNKYKKN